VIHTSKRFAISTESSPVHWLVQTNLGPSSGIGDLLRALDAEHTPFTELALQPMVQELPKVNVPEHHAIVVYGTTNLVDMVARMKPWYPGVFFQPERFTYAAWAEHYGAHLLNSPDETIRTTFAGALSLDLMGEHVFVRPERDLKEFNGGIQKTTDFLAWARDVHEVGGYPQINGDTPIVIGQPHGIANEWRVFVTDTGDVLGSSQYRRNGRMELVNNAPDEVLAFAQARAREWSPAPVFVMDVARSGKGLFIVEAQCAHSSGFYAMPMRPWVRGMNAVVERAMDLRLV
jgi:hypothetical protein